MKKLKRKIYQYPGQHSQSVRSELVSLSGQALATRTLSCKEREERVEEDGSDVIICVFTRDHSEKSLLLPRAPQLQNLTNQSMSKWATQNLHVRQN